MRDDNVILYSAEWCAYCVVLRKKLDARGVEYDYRDVDDSGIREEMARKTNGNQTIPVLFVGEKYWVNPGDAILNEHLSDQG